MSKENESMDMPMSPPGSMNMNDMVMHMSLYWGKHVYILFQNWPGNNNLGMYILALAFVFLLSAATEVLSISPVAKPGSSQKITVLIQAMVYAARMAMVYMVMLSVMSYNLGVFIVAVVGHGLGFFLVKTRARSAAAYQATLHSTDPKV